MIVQTSDSNQPKKLLIVDDDPGIRQQLQWGFEGYDVITAENRQMALQAINQHRPQVVTLDLGLPPDEAGTAEGFETLSQILHQAPNTKVVVVSASEAADNQQRAMDSGAFDFFPKPVNIGQLKAIIERAYISFMGKT